MARIVFGNHPFDVPKDKPMRIGKEQVGYFTYPDYAIETSDLNNLYISTSELTMGYFELAPGAKFSPPDHHPGDECYYILEGELMEVNPITGQAVRVQENEVLIIPQEGAHGGYNFGTKRMKAIFALAPQMVNEEEQKFPTDLDGMWRVLKGKDEANYKVYPNCNEIGTYGSISDVGKWPVTGEELRKDPKYLRVIKEDNKLNVINGLNNPYLMRFACSNNNIHFGEIIFPSGGVGCRVSDPESHEGETAIFVTQGTISFIMMESREVFKIEKDEMMFIPKNTEYQMVNNWAEPAHAVFTIAPNL
jgi:Mannose-6-phosphate isomerase